MNTEKGHFLVFEGIDGSGKTTQINLLKKRIEKLGIKCIQTKEPSDGPVGLMLRRCLTGELELDEITMAGLFAADRLDHIFNNKTGILKNLDENITVICDRYILSTYAYQSVCIPLEQVIKLNSISTENIKPDCHIFIDISPDTALERITQGRTNKELYENKLRLTQVRNRYFELFDILKNNENIIIINGNKNIDEISDDIWKNVSSLF